MSASLRRTQSRPSDGAPARLLYTYADAGELLDVSASTVRRLVVDGELDAVRFRGSSHIPLESLLGFIERLRRRT